MFLFPALVALFISVTAGAQTFDTQPTVYLDQNWSANVRQAFYTTPQGSHLIPLSFARALRDPRTGAKFFTSNYLKQYGFISQIPDPKLNPLGLPVGLTIDGYTSASHGEEYASASRGPRYVGLNCAACHTNNLSLNGKTVRIDGGQSLLNFQAFVNGMDEALFATAADQDRLAEFLNRARQTIAPMPKKRKIRAQFERYISERREWRRMNTSPQRYGFGRTDAFGVIFNQVLARSMRVPANAHEPNAPVSFPVLWDTPHHDFVQWTGLVSNNPQNGGALARNIGQVLGVFGHVDIFNPTLIVNGYCSSARRRGLLALEKWTKDLVSPTWPEEVFGLVDQNMAARGQSHYQQHCLGCHAVLADTRSPNRTVQAKLIPVPTLGVDPQLSINSARLVQSGPLQGRRTELVSGRRLAETEPATILLSHVVGGAIVGSFSALSCHNKIDATPKMISQAWNDLFQRLLNPPPDDPLDSLPADKRNALIRQGLARIKARPLNGIWASPPFLHNGSVKNIYELLQAASTRSQRFVLGCTNFDPAKLGYECGSPETVGQEAALSVLDIEILGSSNSGHEYGTGLTEAERYEVLEYLKTL